MSSFRNQPKKSSKAFWKRASKIGNKEPSIQEIFQISINCIPSYLSMILFSSFFSKNLLLYEYRWHWICVFENTSSVAFEQMVIRFWISRQTTATTGIIRAITISIWPLRIRIYYDYQMSQGKAYQHAGQHKKKYAHQIFFHFPRHKWIAAMTNGHFPLIIPLVITVLFFNIFA